MGRVRPPAGLPGTDPAPGLGPELLRSRAAEEPPQGWSRDGLPQGRKVGEIRVQEEGREGQQAHAGPTGGGMDADLRLPILCPNRPRLIGTQGLG